MAEGVVATCRRRLCLPSVILAVAMAGCGASAPYHGGASWDATLPSGWYRLNFSESAGKVVSAGVQISNVPLQRPTLTPGLPVQVRDSELPADGVALDVATDKDRQVVPNGRVAALPLPLPAPSVSGWIIGSARSGQPYIETLTFRANGKIFVADLKVGSAASGSTLKALAYIIRSLHILT